MAPPSLDLGRILCGNPILRQEEGPVWLPLLRVGEDPVCSPSSDSGRVLCGSPLLRLGESPVWLPHLTALGLGGALLSHRYCRVEIRTQRHLSPQALPKVPLVPGSDQFPPGAQQTHV